MILPIKKEFIVIDNKARDGSFCKLPYPNHPKGCPNYGKRESCPPFAKKFNDIIIPPFYLVIQEFDIESHAIKYKKKYPTWSERQCRNLLYWQKGVVKKLKMEAYDLAKSLGKEFIVLEVPEANGVHLFETCKNIGIELQRYPQKIIRKIMIVGKSKKQLL